MASQRRVVKRAMTRDIATKVRRRIEEAQAVYAGGTPTATAMQRERARRTLDEYGVTAWEAVTQSRHRIMRYWRVYAES